jgi:hypothetical protein
MCSLGGEWEQAVDASGRCWADSLLRGAGGVQEGGRARCRGKRKVLWGGLSWSRGSRCLGGEVGPRARSQPANEARSSLEAWGNRPSAAMTKHRLAAGGPWAQREAGVH